MQSRVAKAAAAAGGGVATWLQVADLPLNLPQTHTYTTPTITTTMGVATANGNANAKPLKCVTKERIVTRKNADPNTLAHTHTRTYRRVCTPLFDLQNGGNKRRVCSARAF